MSSTDAALDESYANRHIGGLRPAQQFGFYFQFIYRCVFGFLAFLYVQHFGIADGLLPYDGAIIFIVGYVFITTCIMFLSRIQKLALPARNGLLVLDLSTLAFGMPFDPNPGLPLLSTIYLGFLDTGLRYGAQLYLRQLCGAIVALGIMIFLRVNHTESGFSWLDAWHVVLFLSIVAYGVPVFAIRERTFRALKQTQDRLQLSLEAPGVAMWSTDSPLQTIHSDGNLERILGVSPENFSGRMADYIGQIHPEDRERVVSDYTQFVRGRTDEYDSEYRILGLDGFLRTVNVRARAVRDSQGRVISVSGMAWDITENRRQQQALLKMEERYRLATGAARVGVWVWNVAEREFEIDESLRTLFGLTTRVAARDGRLRLSQDDFFALIHPDDRQQHAVYVTSLLSSNASEYFREFRIPLEPGEDRDIQARGTIFRNAQGRIQRVAGVAWDATQLMEARRALERKTADLVRMDERYRLATHAARVGAWVWSIADGKFEIDESMSVVFDFPPPVDEHASVRVLTMQDFMARVHPDDRKRLAHEGVAALKSNSSDYFQEYRIRLDSGEVRGIQSRGTVFRNAAGRATQAAGVVWDATELLEARSALELKTQELERANKELDDFSYTASHDLKEPLRGIGNYAQYLQEDYGAQLDEKGQSMLLKMREQAKRMETLITELLNVARLSRAALIIEHTDLQATLVEILASLEFSIREGNVEIRIPRPLPNLRCDRVRVGELLRNLITNGLKYNDKPERWLEIGYDGPDNDPVFYVRDNGIGIRPEHRDRVFSLFQRLHTREAYGGGTGAGLTIAQKIVEMHSGRIWIESLPGTGTTFHFTLGKGTTA